MVHSIHYTNYKIEKKIYLWSASSESLFPIFKDSNPVNTNSELIMIIRWSLISSQGSLQKLPQSVIFQTERAGYWVQFSTSNNSSSLFDHCLLYHLCAKLTCISKGSCLLKNTLLNAIYHLPIGFGNFFLFFKNKSQYFNFSIIINLKS